jgi:hypothetical protein
MALGDLRESSVGVHQRFATEQLSEYMQIILTFHGVFNILDLG